jgi:hypothetical protein
MERGAIIFIKPVSRIERKQRDLRSLRQVGGLVDDQPPSLHTRLQSHDASLLREGDMTNLALRNPSLQRACSSPRLGSHAAETASSLAKSMTYEEWEERVLASNRLEDAIAGFVASKEAVWHLDRHVLEVDEAVPELSDVGLF